MSSTSVVTLEVMLNVQRLVRKFGAEQDSLTWDLIVDIVSQLITFTQVLNVHTCTHCSCYICHPTESANVLRY